MSCETDVSRLIFGFASFCKFLCRSIFGWSAFFRVDHYYSNGNQDQGQETVDTEGLILFAKEESRKDYSDYRIGEAEDTDPAYRIVLQKDSPYGISNGRNDGHIEEQQETQRCGHCKMTAHKEAACNQHGTSQNKLVTAEHYR